MRDKSSESIIDIGTDSIPAPQRTEIYRRVLTELGLSLDKFERTHNDRIDVVLSVTEGIIESITLKMLALKSGRSYTSRRLMILDGKIDLRKLRNKLSEIRQLQAAEIVAYSDEMEEITVKRESVARIRSEALVLGLRDLDSGSWQVTPRGIDLSIRVRKENLTPLQAIQIRDLLDQIDRITELPDRTDPIGV